MTEPIDRGLRNFLIGWVVVIITAILAVAIYQENFACR